MLVLACAAAVLLPDEAQARRSRYRPMPGHPWLEDRETGRYPHAHCELRVALARRLPEPLTSPDTGDLLEKTVITATTRESADIVLTDVVVADGWRTWLWRDLPDASRLGGKSRLAIAVRWPKPDGSREREPTEFFALPALDAHPPWHWSPWQRAVQVRQGEHVLFESATATAALPLPEHPFELRCRTVLSEELAVPAADQDPTIARDEDGHTPDAPRN